MAGRQRWVVGISPGRTPKKSPGHGPCWGLHGGLFEGDVGGAKWYMANITSCHLCMRAELAVAVRNVD